MLTEAGRKYTNVGNQEILNTLKAIALYAMLIPSVTLSERPTITFLINIILFLLKYSRNETVARFYKTVQKVFSSA